LFSYYRSWFATVKARTEDSKGEENLISKQARKNVNEKGRLEQTIEREPHVEHIENYFMLILKKSFSLYFFECLTLNGIVDLICTFFFL
jgi:hypothetical protein